MLKTRLLHPQILEALGEAGHGARVLIADGNYPLATQSNPAGRRVYLNLTAGRLGVIEVLEVLAESIPIEAAHVMGPDDSSEPSIYARLPPACCRERSWSGWAGSSSTRWPGGRTRRSPSPPVSSGCTPTCC